MNRISIKERVSLTKRGFGVLKEYCPGLVQGKALYELLNSLQPFISVWFSARIIDEIAGQRRMAAAAAYVTGAVLLNFLCAALKGIVGQVCNKREAMMWSWFRKIFADKEMTLDFEDVENAEIQRRRQDVEENLYMFGNGLAQLVWGTPTFIRIFVNIAASAALTFTLFLSKTGNRLMDHPVWMAGLLLGFILSGLINSSALKKENDIFINWCKGTVWFNRVFQFYGRDLYMNPEKAKDVRIYKQNSFISKIIGGLAQKDREDRKPNFQRSFYPALGVLAVGAADMVCYLFVVAKAFLGAFSVGNIVQYVAALSKLGEGVKEFMYMLADNEVYCLHLKKMFEFLDLPNKMYQGSLTVEKRDDNEYYVEFRDVSFKYPKTDIYALHHVNIKFKVGEKLAVVGMNGSGKTTFIKLLCRLYDPTEGEILLNDVNIKKYDYQEYMSIFSVVFQDFQLFSFSLGQNVAASAEFDREKVLACLEKAGFGERLESMPKGAETSLYKNFDSDGVEVSGGEAQKIALARALYKGAPFIILDEPTAALDPVSEYEVYSKFDEIAGDRTAVYISHRLASCRFCDKIAVFHEGAVIQTGNHEELLADTDGKYYELWNAQAQYYTIS